MSQQYQVRTPAAGAAGSAGNAITSAGASGAIAVGDFDFAQSVTLEIQGITTGTVQMQTSIDGSVWVNQGSPLTADGRVVLSTSTGIIGQVRANVTVDTDVAVLVKVAGVPRAGHA